MPGRWKCIERMYGPHSKHAGKTYLRFHSLNGKHRNVTTPRKAIQLGCEEEGIDSQPVIEKFEKLQKEQRERAQKEKLARPGEVQGEEKGAASARFRKKYGRLKAPVVFYFKGWTTRFRSHQKVDQCMVEHIDPAGKSWTLLKDLECSLQMRMEDGQSEELDKLIREAKAEVDLAVFAEGYAKVREAGRGRVYETSPVLREAGEDRVLPLEGRAAKKQRR